MTTEQLLEGTRKAFAMHIADFRALVQRTDEMEAQLLKMQNEKVKQGAALAMALERLVQATKDLETVRDVNGEHAMVLGVFRERALAAEAKEDERAEWMGVAR